MWGVREHFWITYQNVFKKLMSWIFKKEESFFEKIQLVPNPSAIYIVSQGFLCIISFILPCYPINIARFTVQLKLACSWVSILQTGIDSGYSKKGQNGLSSN